MTAASNLPTKRLYQQEDVFRSKHVVNGVLSPDESFAIYQLSETVPGKTKDEDRQLSALWQISLTGSEPKRLTAKGKDATSPQLAPDGRSLFFLSARDNKTAQIYRLPLDGGEAEEITELEQGVTSFALSPDGEWIAFAARENVPQPAGPNDHIRITGFIYRFNSFGYLQNARQAVHVMPSKGGAHKALTAYDGLINAMVWSPDSREIAVFIIATAAQKSWPGQGELSILYLDGVQKKLLHDMWIIDLFWAAGGKQIGYVAFPDGNYSRQLQLFTIDSNGGSPTCRTSHLDLPVVGGIQINSPGGRNHLQLTEDGGRIIAPVSKGGETGLYKIALSGPEAYEPIISGQQRTCRILSRVGASLLFSSQDFSTPSELWVADLTTGQERSLTHHNAQWQSEIAWPDVEHITVSSSPGVEVEGWVFAPPQGKAPFKTILYIHGGPHAAFGYGFHEDFNELVGAGYAVAFANTRGSTGYGDAFSTAIVERRGIPETEDFNAFLDKLVTLGIADPDKLGVTGVSGGGHLSAWLIGQTDRFKAAIPEQGSYNMFTEYSVSDCGVALTPMEMGGFPNEQFQRYWELSPVAHAYKCKTPTLLIQGEDDLRCPMEEAEQLYTMLKHSGCDVEFLRLKCSHGMEVVGPPQLRRFRMDAIKDWFSRYIQ